MSLFSNHWAYKLVVVVLIVVVVVVRFTTKFKIILF
jgi:hypothetical protein